MGKALQIRTIASQQFILIYSNNLDYVTILSSKALNDSLPSTWRQYYQVYQISKVNDTIVEGHRYQLM